MNEPPKKRLRKTSFTPFKVRKQENQLDLCKIYVAKGKDRDGLEVKKVNKYIGKGLFATKKIHSGDFIVQYHGELLSKEEANKRMKNYPSRYGSYFLFFTHKGKDLCIDATFSPLMGRYANDGIGSERNAEVKCIECSGQPVLAIFAVKNIQPGDEIRYNYGVDDLYWRPQPLGKHTQEDKPSTVTSTNPNLSSSWICNEKQTSIKDCRVVLVREKLEKSHHPLYSRKRKLQDKNGSKMVKIEHARFTKDLQEQFPEQNARSKLEEEPITEQKEKEDQVSPEFISKSEIIEACQTHLPVKQRHKKTCKEKQPSNNCYIDKLQNTQDFRKGTSRHAHIVRTKIIFDMAVEASGSGPVDTLQTSQEKGNQSCDPSKQIEGLYNQQTVSSKDNTSHQSYLTVFLTKLTSSTVADQAILNKYVIQEEDVETMPENIDFDEPRLFDETFQSLAKPYFTDDAWICAKNTLGMVAKSRGEILSADCTNESTSSHTQHSHFPKRTLQFLSKRTVSSAEPDSGSKLKTKRKKRPITEQKEKEDQVSKSEIIEACQTHLPVEQCPMKTCKKKQPSNNFCIDKLQNTQDYRKGMSRHAHSVRKKIIFDTAVEASGSGPVDTLQTSQEEGIQSCDPSKQIEGLYNQQTVSSKDNTSHQSYLTIFLTKLTSSTVADQAILNKYVIQEEDVETMPENIDFDEPRLFEETFQSLAKPYFTEDAWICAKNTLGMVAKSRGEILSADCADESTSSHTQPSQFPKQKLHLLSKRPVSSAEPDSGSKLNTKRKQKAKPFRPCPFCNKLLSKLRTHLVSKHANEKDVQSALILPKQERDYAFDLIKKKGIMKMNLKIMGTSGKSQKDLIRERCQGSPDVVYCSKCLAFLRKRYFHRHQRTCYMAHDKADIPRSMTSSIKYDPDAINDFQKEILNSFHGDSVGEICRTDDLVVGYGKREYLKVKLQKDKKDEKRGTLKSEMRRLGKLLEKFREVCKEGRKATKSSLEMFSRERFHFLETSIIELSSKPDGAMKDGYKLGMGYLLKKVAKYIQGEHLINKEDEKAEEVSRFLSVLQFHWTNIFGDSEYAVKKQRQTVLRKPQNLPLEEDVEKLRKYTIQEIQRIGNDKYTYFTQSDFVLLRDLLVCRLTLFNARRGGEPSRLLMREWNDADSGVWYDKTTLSTQDPTDKMLLGRYKLAYQSGKTGKLVPLLIINDCWNALKILTDPIIRNQVGIPKSNTFVFPCTQMSSRHVIGWNSVQKCSMLAKCHSTVTATIRRHQVATLYAANEVSPEDRKAFLLHMDHGEGINANVYQSPPAVQETIRVGRFLHTLDSPGDSLKCPTNDTTTEQTHELITPAKLPVTASCAGIRAEKEIDECQKLKRQQHYLNQRQHGIDTLGAGESLSGIRAEKEIGECQKSMRQQHYLNQRQHGIDTLGAGESLSGDDDRDEDYRPTEDSDDSESSDETSDALKRKKESPKKPRVYRPWSRTDTDVIKTYFHDFIFNTDNIQTNVGRLPGKMEVTKFLCSHDSILSSLPLSERVKRVKLKVFNERKMTREKLRKISKPSQ